VHRRGVAVAALVALLAAPATVARAAVVPIRHAATPLP
jgi:hypothetical protein